MRANTVSEGSVSEQCEEQSDWPSLVGPTLIRHVEAG